MHRLDTSWRVLVASITSSRLNVVQNVHCGMITMISHHKQEISPEWVLRFPLGSPSPAKSRENMNLLFPSLLPSLLVNGIHFLP